MHSYMKFGLALSLVAISSLYGVDITIDEDTPYKTYKKYLKDDWFIFGGDNNNITWNDKPKSHEPVNFKIRGGYSDTKSVIGNKLIFNNYLDKGELTHIIAGESAEANSADNTLIIQENKKTRSNISSLCWFWKIRS